MCEGKILAIDDERNIRHLIQSEFALEGFQVMTANSGEEGLKLCDEQIFDVVLLDIKLPKMNGIEALKHLKQKSPDTNVIMITGYGDIHSAVESMKFGAIDYITKPFKLNELLALVKQAIRNNREASEPLKDTLIQGHKNFILCPSQPMQKLYQLAERVAKRDNTVLIQGETGVGKDILAYYIHLLSHRKDETFIIVDCGMLSQNLAESELYGHKKGAFSGATESKRGLVEKSDKGTLFLDEIGNIDLDLQKKFLRFLETKKFRRIGETKEISIDARIILATNLDMEDAIQKGTLRKDLFYRMDTICFTISPLRERKEDIMPLAKHFLKTIGDPGMKISKETAQILMEYHWPGNIRELKSVISKSLIMADNNNISPEALPAHITLNKKAFPRRPKTLEDVEKEHIMAILEETGGNQTIASGILGINRKTLYKKIHKHKIFS